MYIRGIFYKNSIIMLLDYIYFIFYYLLLRFMYIVFFCIGLIDKNYIIIYILIIIIIIIIFILFLD